MQDPLFAQIHDLTDKETLEYIQRLKLGFIQTNDVAGAGDLLEIVDDFLKRNSGNITSDQNLIRDYQEIKVILEFIALYTLPEKDIPDIFKHSLLIAFKFDINIFEKIDLLFLLYRDELTGNTLRQSLISAILENTEKIGRGELRREGSAITAPPTVQNWLKVFFSSFPSDRPLSQLEELEFMNKNQNVKFLSPEEKILLRKVFHLYNYLKFPVKKEKLVRETGHRLGGITETVQPARQNVSRVAPPQANIDPFQLLQQKYQSYRSQRQRFLEAEDAINTRTKGDLESVKRELANAVRAGEKFRTAACLFILANQQVLITALQDNPSWFAAVAEYIQKKYTSSFNQEQVKLAVSNLKLEPTTSAALSEFLQYILREKMKMNENDSALVGVEIGQILGGLYQSLAYGNQNTGNFEWIKNKIVNGKLVSEIG